MPEMYTAHDVRTGAQLRRFRFADPMRALAHGYAYVARYPDRDFVVRDEAGRPVPASRCRAIHLALREAKAS